MCAKKSFFQLSSQFSSNAIDFTNKNILFSTLFSFILDTPVCKDDRVVVVGASRGEMLDIECRVEADPPAHRFRWKFNNSGEIVEVPVDKFSVNPSSGLSVLKYTPATELDYGTLSCWAENIVGEQCKHCLFQLVAAGKLFIFRHDVHN